MSYGTDRDAFAADDGYGGLADTFSEKAVRLGFIRKVYSILTAQLVVTMGIVGLFFVDTVRDYAYQNTALLYAAFFVTLACLITLTCCSDIGRKTPHNFIFLGLFTVAEGFLLGVVTASYQADEVLIAIGICAAVTLALTAFAFQSKIDFTAWGGTLLAVLVVFSLFGFIMIFLPRDRTMYLVYACIGAVIFSLYIVFDTQMMLGGKHKYSLSPEEYVFAALNLYLDIINLFLYILRIVGIARD